MKKILRLLGDYYRSCFNWTAFLLCAFLATGLIVAAYRQQYYMHTIEYEPRVGIQILKYCVMYFIAFGGAFLLQAFGEKDYSVFRSGRWWFLMIFAVLLFSIRGSDLPFGEWFFGATKSAYPNFYGKIGYNLAGLVFLLLPCWIYWRIYDRKNQPFYGFHAKGVTLSPYFILLALMLPLLLWAGTQPDFLDTYPRYTKIGIPDTNPLYRMYAGIYELAYGSDFVFTEFFFRGFVILAFAVRFGHRAILPMCVCYVTIHFGKPLGETISSFFGGLLLGVIAFRTRSIYGGIIIHLGIAYLMELVAMMGRAGWLHF